MATDEHLEWFPFYPGRFLTDLLVATADLDAVGALVKLQAQQWIHGPLPEDLGRLGKLLAVDGERMAELWDTIGVRFTLTGDGWVDEEVEALRQEQLDKRKQRRRAGKKGAQSRWGKGHKGASGRHAPANGTANAAAMAKPSQPDQDANGALSLSLSSDEGSSTLEDEFDVFWKAYPDRKGNNPRGEALEAYKARRREGVTAAELLEGVKRYAAQREEEGEVGTPFVMRATTFLRSGEGWLQEWTLTGTSGRGDNGRGDDPGLEATTETGKGWTR